MAVPKWAKNMKKDGQAVQERNGNYYLYNVRYGYDSTTKRSRIIKKEYVGRLSEKEGLIKKSIRIHPEKKEQSIGSPLEYEASNLLEILGRDIRENLVSVFGEEDGNAIMAIGKIGLIEKEPEKRIRNAYESSYESVRYPGLPLSPSSISRLTERIGRDRGAQVLFMKKYVNAATHLIFDGTRLVCYSERIDLARKGYNHSMIWDPQVNLMYCFSLKPLRMPVYFMPFKGNKPDVSNIMASIHELGLKDAFLICDKGFRDKKNLTELKENGIVFLTPLKRNSSEIDWSFLKGKGTGISAYGRNAFQYHGRPIYYHVCQEYGYIHKEIKKRGRKPRSYVPEYATEQKDMVVLFLDLELKAKEEQDFSLSLIGGDMTATEEEIREREKYFGTITLTVNKSMSPQELYETYKERELIEDGNKAYKHVLGDFASNKQMTDTYNGWLFLNHISLMLYYRVLGKIKEKGLSSKYSVEDVIDVAKRITMQNIGGSWNENMPALTDMKPYFDVMQ